MKVTVAFLLSLYAFLALSASTHKGPSYDEGEEIAVGYNIWLRHDFRMEAANGDLVKRWATLPLLFTKPHFPPANDPNWRGSHPYLLAYKFFFQNGNRPESLLLQTRAMVMLLGVATGLLIFLCSREMFGDAGGLVSLCLFVFSPHMLAFGGIVSTELSICLTLLGATWWIWRLLNRVTCARLCWSLTFAGLAFLAKPSALLIVPITIALIAIRLIRNVPLEWSIGTRKLIRSRGAQLGIFFGFFICHALFAWVAIWAAYDFRFAASPFPSDPGIELRTPLNADPIEPAVLEFVGWCNRTHFLPQGYLHGIKYLLSRNDWRQCFMDGHWRMEGWRSFFPYAIWAKTPPALFLLLPLGLVMWWRTRQKENRSSQAAAMAPSFYAASPFFVLVVVYMLVAVTQNMDIGHRHILPVYPPLYVLAGSAALVRSSRNILLKIAAAGLLLAFAVDSVAVYPDFLAYFSPIVGGPAQGYRHLVDSSLDWGMDLPGLKRWLAKNNPGDREPVYLGYFGVGDPDYYQIKYNWLFGDPGMQPHVLAPMRPGIYAISATSLQTLGTRTFGPWNPVYESSYWNSFYYVQNLRQIARAHLVGGKVDPAALPKSWDSQALVFEELSFGRLCAWLRHNRPPDAEVGYSILIWRLSADDLRSALLSPPAEMINNPYVHKWHR